MLNVKKIEELRKALKINIDDFCKEVGITKPTYYTIKVTKDFRISQLYKAASVLKVSVDELLVDSGCDEGSKTNSLPESEKDFVISKLNLEVKYLKESIKNKDALIKAKDMIIEEREGQIKAKDHIINIQN